MSRRSLKARLHRIVIPAERPPVVVPVVEVRVVAIPELRRGPVVDVALVPKKTDGDQ